MRKLNRNRFVKTNESYRPKFTKICYTGKGIQLEDGEGRVLRGKVFASEEEARAYATKMYGFCRNESTVKRRGKTMWKRINESCGNIRCDWCGFSSDNENRFTEIGDQTVCRMCMSRNKYCEESPSNAIEVRISSRTFDDLNTYLWDMAQSYWEMDNMGGGGKSEMVVELYSDVLKWLNDWGFTKHNHNPVTLDVDGEKINARELAKTVLDKAYNEMKMDDDLERQYELDMYEEGWLGDKMKVGWEKVKTGAKKVGKAIGDVFNGPFRKGDHIVMKGEDGEEFKGTIKRFDMDDKTYEVILGNPVNEDWDGRGLEEDVLDMPDRVEELDEEIDRLWRRLGDVDDKTVSKLILACIELEKLEPGRIVDALDDYANFTEK